MIEDGVNKEDEAVSGLADWQLNLILTIFSVIFILRCNYKNQN